MQWSDESIEQAIQTARTKNAIFVVYVEDNSRVTPLHDILESPEISNLLQGDQFVAVRIQSDTEYYRNFSAIYHFVPVPSIFFIGSNGWPIEIISGELPQNSILERINRLVEQSDVHPENSIVKEQQEEQIADQTTLPLEKQLREMEINPSCSGSDINETSRNTTNKDTKVGSLSETESICSNVGTSTASVDDLLNSDGDKPKKRDTVNQLRRSSLDGDGARRRLPAQSTLTHGSSYIHGAIPRVQTIRERPVVSRTTDRNQPTDLSFTGVCYSLGRWMRNALVGGNRLTLRNAQQPLELDRVPGFGSLSFTNIQSPNVSGVQEFAHIQFRLPDGSTHSRLFQAKSSMGEVRDYVQNNIALPFREFRLSTSYPRIEFTNEHMSLTIASLGLVPRSVILIIPSVEGARPFASVGEALWTLLVWPFSAVYTVMTYFSLWFGRSDSAVSGTSDSTQTRTEQPAQQNGNNSAGNMSGARRRLPSSSVVQRDGNVYRLSNRQEDSDEENNTWNGNSTQQM